MLIPANSARGLAPPSALNKLSFEPAQSVDELINSIRSCLLHKANILITSMSKD